MQDQIRRPITVSIVSHGQLGLIRPLLEQLERFCLRSIEKVVLTVNVPEPDLLEGFNSCLPIERIINSRPQGFGANHNAAFARCESEWFLVLNPDIRLAADVLRELLQRAAFRSGLLAPRILEPGRNAPEPHRALLTPREILCRHRADYRAPVRPAWVPGMFMLLRADAFREIAGFDRRFYMYGEDFDLCARLQLAGWRLQIVEHLHVGHEAQRASRRAGRHLLWHFTSLARVWCSQTFWKYRAQYRTRAMAD